MTISIYKVHGVYLQVKVIILYCLQLSLSKTLDYNDNGDAGSDPDFDTKDIEKVETKKPKKVKKKPKTTTKQLLFKKDEKSLNFECDQCEKKFATMQGLKMHTTNSHDQVCELCSEEFSSTKEMQIHLKDKHPDCGDKNYKCTLCMKYFFLESSLENHKGVDYVFLIFSQFPQILYHERN